MTVTRGRTASCWSTSRPGGRRTTSSRGERRRLGRGMKVGHAGTLDPFATGLLLVLVGRATRVQRFLMALPKRYEVVARLGWTSTTGDPEGEIAPGGTPAEPLALPTGRVAPAPARLLGGEGRRRGPTRSRARGEAVELPERDVTVTASSCSGARATAPRSRSSARLGHLRALARRRPRRRLLPGAAAHARSAPFDVADAEPLSSPLDDALAFLPARRAGGRRRAPRRPRRARSPGAAAGTVRLRDDDGPDRPRRAPPGRHAQARRRLPRLMERHLAPRRRSPGPAASPSASSTASTSATARSCGGRTPC